MAGTATKGGRWCPTCQAPVLGRQRTQMGWLIVTEAPTGPVHCDRCGSDTVPVEFAKHADTFLMVKAIAGALVFLAIAVAVIVAMVTG